MVEKVSTIVANKSRVLELLYVARAEMTINEIKRLNNSIDRSAIISCLILPYV